MEFGDPGPEGGEFGEGLLECVLGEGVAGAEDQCVAVEGRAVAVISGGKMAACRGVGVGILAFIQRHLAACIVIDPRGEGFV